MWPNWPPAPSDPCPALNLFTDGNGNYFYDDRQVDYSSSWPLMVPLTQQAGPLRAGVVTADDGPPFPPFDGYTNSGGTNPPPIEVQNFIPPTPGYTNCETWPNFWLIPPTSSGNEFYGAISNTLNGVGYVVCYKTSLSDPAWTPIQSFIASGP